MTPNADNCNVVHFVLDEVGQADKEMLVFSESAQRNMEHLIENNKTGEPSHMDTRGPFSSKQCRTKVCCI